MFKEKLDFSSLDYIQNQIRFYLYKDKTKYRWNSINFPPKYNSKEDYINNGMDVNSSTICFSSLNSQLNDESKDYTRMIFLFEKSKSVPRAKQKRWLALCKRNGLLPKYASVAAILKNRGIVLDITKHTRNLMYVYLTVCRFIQEDPCMVINTLTLCEDYGMDFFVALVFATQIRMNNMGHHFLPGSSIYMKPKTVDHLKNIQVQQMVGLYRFLKKQGPHVGGERSFCANTSVAAQCKIKIGLMAKDLLNPELKNIIRAKTDAEAEKLIKAAKLGG
jgi:hypothetical protein